MVKSSKRTFYFSKVCIITRKQIVSTIKASKCSTERRTEREEGDLKVHKRENFLGFDFEICTFS
jgi:hypothetical protein